MQYVFTEYILRTEYSAISKTFLPHPIVSTNQQTNPGKPIEPVAMPPPPPPPPSRRKRQKLDNNNTPDIMSRRPPPPPAQQGIRAFGTISKPLGGNNNRQGKSKLDGPRPKPKPVDGRPENVVVVVVAALIDVDRRCLKRKRKGERKGESLQLQEEDLVEEEEEEELVGRDCCLLRPPAEPSSSSNQPNTIIREKARRTPPQINYTPLLKAGRACLESLPLVPSSPSDLNVISSTPSEASGTPPSSPPSSKSLSPHSRHTSDSPLQVPDELQDLIDLHSSFLTALSLHYAHNGSLAPVDLCTIRSGIERSWRRRRVSNDDVRRILGIGKDISANGDQDEWPSRPGVLSLSDYGGGKICIEMNAHSQPQGSQRRPLAEEALHSRFAQDLFRRWDTYCDSCGTFPIAGAFMMQLPLAPVILCASVAKISPFLAKGQQRLEDLKSGAIRAQRNSSTLITSCSAADGSLTPKPATSRNSSLLSRIRAKQLHQSTLAPPPDQATLLRTSALHRLQEIIPVLEILTTSASRSLSTPSIPSHASAPSSSPPAQASSHPDKVPLLQSGTCSFTMATLVQHLQMSLRNPIAKEEAIRCVRLLADEVVPEWIGVRQVGKLVGVTVRKGRRVGREEVKRRVEGLLRERESGGVVV